MVWLIKCGVIWWGLLRCGVVWCGEVWCRLVWRGFCVMVAIDIAEQRKLKHYKHCKQKMQIT